MALVDEFWAGYEGSPELKSVNGHPFTDTQLLREIVFELRALRADIAAVNLRSDLEPIVMDASPAGRYAYLPDDFPAIEVLREEGIFTPAEIERWLESGEKIKGVGPATKAVIIDALRAY